MKLSIYVGLRAIGWVVTNDDEVIKRGIKRVNVDFDHYYEYLAGQPVSLRITRRQKRQARRNLWRYKSRRKNLRIYLQKNGIFSRKRLHRDTVLSLRSEALHRPLTNEELYCVLMSLQSKRGYKSLRGVSDNENSDYLKTIAYHEEQRELHESIAEYLNTLPSSKNIIFNRSSYEQEFWSIMKNQNLPIDVQFKIFNLIYFQRPIKKGVIANCRLETNRKVMHSSHPLFQEFRCWRDANNIIIWDDDMNEIDVPSDIRISWAKKLLSGRNLTKASCCKDLGIKKSTSYHWLSGKQLAGNPVADISEELWQDLFSAVENDRLRKLLHKKYQFSEFEIDKLVDLELHKLGWAEYSAKAVRKLLPLLKEGTKLSEAIMKEFGKVENRNVALRNVILEKHFDSYKSLVETVKRQFPISDTVFEIDPLLKMGNKQRKELAKHKRADAKFEKEHEAILAGRSEYNKFKYKLWKESEGISPYEPDYIIPLEELFSDKYDLDHIVPKSKLFETGEANIVLCRRELNQQKGRMTAYDFATQKLGFTDEQWKEVAEKFGSKKKFLLMKEEEIPTDWISRRQNSDYNTKCFGTLANVNIPNKLINKFAKEWKLNRYNTDDCRHYLYKAFVLANLDQSIVDRFDDIQSIKEKAYHLHQRISLPDGFEQVIPFIPKIKMVRKNKYGYYPSKQLHQETILGKRIINGKTFYKVRQPLAKISPKMVSNIYSQDIKIAMEEWILQNGGLENAKAHLEEIPFIFRGNDVTAVSVRMTDNDLPFLRHKSGDLIHSKTNEGQPVDFVYTENNFALLTTIEKGKFSKILIPLMNHIDIINRDQINYDGTLWKKFDIVEHENHYYYFIGCGLDNAIRSVYDLNASETVRINTKMYQTMKKIKINQLGDVIA